MRETICFDVTASGIKTIQKLRDAARPLGVREVQDSTPDAEVSDLRRHTTEFIRRTAQRDFTP